MAETLYYRILEKILKAEREKATHNDLVVIYTWRVYCLFLIYRKLVSNTYKNMY